VLRGASFATRQRMRQPKFRNFELPQANHVFAGFRSCAA
jgi:iron(II)-dependent oxidoreductase